LKRHAFFVLTALCVMAISCSQLTAPEDPTEQFIIRSVTINPTDVLFTPSNGIQDTLISIQVSAFFTEIASSPIQTNVRFVVQLRDALDGSVLREVTKPMDLATPNSQSTTLIWPTTTIQRSELSISVFFLSSDALVSNTAMSRFSIIGFSVGLPEILTINNPAVVQIPSAGTNNFRLSARVVHPFDQSLINRVLVDIRDQNNNLLSGSPFRLYDDGSLQQIDTGGVSGDLAAGDSLYTRQFQVSSSNNPDVYTLFYHAIDNFGASSDTLTSQMIFQR
jgi:hypothetical protein